MSDAFFRATPSSVGQVQPSIYREPPR